jgi:large subunit ribosomal protein L10e
MGDPKGFYTHRISLLSESGIQIRHNALEAARIASNKILANRLGNSGYVLRIKVYPHVILRENRMIATAGADRLQEGMRNSFGKPTSSAARVKRDQPIITVKTNEGSVELAKEALRAGAAKLPTSIRMVVENLPLSDE